MFVLGKNAFFNGSTWGCTLLKWRMFVLATP